MLTYKNFVKRLFVYLKPHLGKLIFTSFLMILATSLESAIPEITGQIVDELFNESRSENTTLIYAWILFLIILMSSLFSLASNATSSWVANIVIMNIRVDMFNKLLHLPKAFFDKTTSGNLLSKLTFDVEQIAGAASTIWLDFIKASITVLILVVYLFYKSWILSISLIVIIPIVFFAVYKSSIRMREGSKKVQKSMGDMAHLLDENISGNSIIRIYQAQEYEKNKLYEMVKTIRQQRFKVAMSASINANLINSLLGLALALVVYFASINLKMTAGEFLSYFTALAMLIKPSKSLININKPLQIAMAAGKSVFDLLDEKSELNKGKKRIKKINGQIQFKDVSFQYNYNKKILNKISFNIEPGETVALVGPTGSGKTTIIELIAKFYLPNEGEILIDGMNLNDINNSDIRENIAYVDQDTRLFNDSIKANINLSKRNILLKNIKKSAELANASDFIEQLEFGYETIIGENGKLLSGGQRQRIAIARAIAKDSPILILDEATSALDSSTEKLVQKAIFKMSENRTTIVIAHRLSTIQNADRIIVMSEGQVIEQGTHDDLLNKAGHYAKLIKDQYK